MWVSIERNQKKKGKPLITLLSLDFFFFLVCTCMLYRIRFFFLPRNITTTSKSGARTDTCDCCCLLLFTLFSILLARTTSGRLWSWCSGLTFLSTYWCKVLRPLCLAGSFRLLLLLPLLMLLFLFLLSSLALSYRLVSLLCFSRVH